jgi:hypothetical protein
VARLAEIPQFVGLKDATGDLARPLRLKALLRPDFCLMSGEDHTALAFMAQGGNGCISVTSNVAPGLCRDMYLALQRGHLAQAQKLAMVLERLTTVLFRESNPAPVKYALSKLKIMSPRVRLPLVELKQATKAEIDAILAELAERYTESLVEGGATQDQTLPHSQPVQNSSRGHGQLAAGGAVMPIAVDRRAAAVPTSPKPKPVEARSQEEHAAGAPGARASE